MDKLKEEARNITPTLQIGKNLLTDGVISELKLQLSKKRLVKIKLLRAALDQKDRFEIAEEISEKTGSKIVMLTGFVLVITKKA